MAKVYILFFVFVFCFFGCSRSSHNDSDKINSVLHNNDTEDVAFQKQSTVTSNIGVISKQRVRYEGELNENKEPHGQGVLIWSNGNRYEGGFNKGTYYGQGVYTLSWGARYEGHFDGDKFKGVLYLPYMPDGSRYEGEFQWSPHAILLGGGMVLDNFPVYVPIGQGVFIDGYTFDSDQEPEDRFQAFGIPLNATIQEVVDAFVENNIDISPYIDVDSTESDLVRQLRYSIEKVYRNDSVENKNKALEIIDQKRLHFSPFRYKDKLRWIYPTSLFRLLNGNMSPHVFHEYFENYNSKFVIHNKGAMSSPDLRSLGFYSVYVTFGSHKQSTPKSCVVSLDASTSLAGASSDIYHILNSKYGLPKLYYGFDKGYDSDKMDFVGGPQYDHRIKQREALKYLKENSSSAEELPIGQILYEYEDIEKCFSVPIPRFNKALQGHTPSQGEFLLEWTYNDIKILAVFCYYFDDDDIKFGPYVISYIDYPVLLQIAEDLKFIEEKSNERKEIIYEQASKRF